MSSEPLDRSARWPRGWISLCLAAAAAVAVGRLLILGTSPEDAEVLESPLVLAAARQFTTSPAELYGPFGGTNPYVLIHAPLYYRATGLAGWGLSRVGLGSIVAALAAGRAISCLGFLGTLVAVYHLARLDGGSRWAGGWGVCLVAAAPVLGSMPAAVRPDMLGVWFQTTAVLLVLLAVRGNRPRGGPIAAALVLFALAVCVKQHFVASAAVCIPLLLVRSWRGPVRGKAVERGLALAAAIVLLVYGTEEVVSGGRMSAAIFRAAASVGAVHPTSWHSAGIVYVAFLGRSLGSVALLVGLGLACVHGKPGWGRRCFSAAAGLLMAAVVAVSISQFFVATLSQIVFQVLAVLAILFLVIPSCAILERRFLVEGRLDAVLIGLVAAELGLAILLCRASTGAWVNYGIPGIVYLSVLLARALDRIVAGGARPVRLGWVAAAAVAPLVSAIGMLVYDLDQRKVDQQARALLVARMARPASEFFFVDRPGANRRNGRPDLVYDEWLYPVFERTGLAEPRSAWLLAKLMDGSVSVVVNTSDGRGIEGVAPALARLGFVKRFSLEPVYFMWERPRYVSPPLAR